MKDRLTALIVTVTIALCLLVVLVAVAILLVGQHTVPAVAVGLVTTLVAFLAPSPLGHAAGGVSEAVQAVLSGAGAAAVTAPAAAAPVTGPVGATAPSIDLTQPDPPPPAPVAPTIPTQPGTSSGAP